ncbi:RagB/SusD family nutrient uptake outer membrane protein [Prolixibacteraceae bacterium Z1-6]|uniref:RagB/SusD family nutrient uptake outer membrane protein n=1 Tax=Draconibacterium aestuarii TaxID=2998507 RepID=A0A9X3J5G0_9BACT|nr:RagB/SusD family nutrient uptake outer membrane protein [Prolixibacteraceae bacterium Z1-6]
MKILKNIIFLVSAIIAVTSCNEEEFLNEVRLDGLDENNAYVTYDNFQSGLVKNYDLVRYYFYTQSGYPEYSYDHQYGTDLVHSGQHSAGTRVGDYAVYLNPTSGPVNWHWKTSYRIIANSNTILTRSKEADLTDEQKTEIEAYARFFRGIGYRTLSYLYGGVPLVLDEVTEPKTDFVRASRTDVYEAMIEDFSFAANNMPQKSEVKPGEVSQEVANFFLAEAYVANGQFSEAVQAATKTINSSNVGLMYERFGTRMSESGDVYWDLFRRGNQNLSENKEGLWVIQFELDQPAGGLNSTSQSGPLWERHHPPLFRDAKRMDNASVKAGFQWPTSDYTGGRGIGWMIPTYHFTNIIWQSDFDNDMRNSEYNFPRKFLFNNPNGADDLQGVIFDSETNPECVNSLATTGQWPRNLYPYQTKSTTPGNHPDALYSNKETGLLLGAAGATYRDHYMLRLPEVYLIRAEAYLGMGQPDKAAADLNVIRRRANASDVSVGDVDIDYILDERMRELGIEEKRRLTLARLGLVYDRTKKYNPYNADDIESYNNLFPIPYGEIEKNPGAELAQNPGYAAGE